MKISPKLIPPILLAVALFSLALSLAACGARQPSASNVFPDGGAIPGWSKDGQPRTFTRDNLFDLVDGQAESFFVYNFELVDVQRYAKADGTLLSAEIWRVTTRDDAYGLFAFNYVGEPLDVGVEGNGDPGQLLCFWQDRYYVRLMPIRPVDDAELVSFASQIAAALPKGGDRPAILEKLPPGVEDSAPLFFHEELSIQSALWLGQGNLLGLSAETEGVLAHYNPNGQKAMLLIVHYPQPEQATAASDRLDAARPECLQVTLVREEWLAAVFGTVDRTAASDLVDRSLQP